MKQHILEICLFGNCSILWPDNMDGTMATRLETALLIFLICQEKPQSREQLSDLFWEDRPVQQARSNLRTLLTRARRTFGNYLHIEREFISFNRKMKYWLDVAEFKRQLSEANQRWSKGMCEQKLVSEQLASTLELYQGDFLGNFILPTSHRYEQWVWQENSSLRQSALDVYHRLIPFYLQTGQFSEGLATTRRLLNLDLHDERTHSYMMQLLVGNRQLEAALTYYHSYCQQIEHEFGLEPSQQLVALYEQIRSGELSMLLLQGKQNGYLMA